MAGVCPHCNRSDSVHPGGNVANASTIPNSAIKGISERLLSII